MKHTARRPLSEYLALHYPFNVAADPEGGYVIVFPDLPGCMTQVDNLEEIGPMAEEIRVLWLTTAYEQGKEIPLPSYSEDFSGKFVVRVPRSLHRALVEGADRDGVSLNQFVVSILARGATQADMQRWLNKFGAQLSTIQEQLDLRSVGQEPPVFASTPSSPESS